MEQEIEGLKGFYKIEPIKYFGKFEVYESLIIMKNEKEEIEEMRKICQK